MLPEELNLPCIASQNFKWLRYAFQLMTNIDIARSQFFATWKSDEEFVRRFLIFGNSDGVYFARQNEFPCILVPSLCRIIQSGSLFCKVFLFLNSSRERFKLVLIIPPPTCCKSLENILRNSIPSYVCLYLLYLLSHHLHFTW